MAVSVNDVMMKIEELQVLLQRGESETFQFKKSTAST